MEVGGLCLVCLHGVIVRLLVTWFYWLPGVIGYLVLFVTLLSTKMARSDFEGKGFRNVHGLEWSLGEAASNSLPEVRRIPYLAFGTNYLYR